jgi:replicative DNA helicase
MMSGGFKPGKLVCIAARPSVGKTSLTLQILRKIAEGGAPVAFLSQEMLREELSNRLVASAGMADYGQIERGCPDNDTWRQVVEGVEILRDIPLYVDDQSGLTLFDIQSKARKLKSKYGINVLAIDYLQLCQTSSRHDNRATAIGEISRGLKKLAMQLGITVVILSQLNRDVEKRVSGKPVMADLKESGDIEQDCDTIMMLSPIQDADGGAVIRCELVKNRAGRKGELALLFKGRYQRWEQTVYDFAKEKKSSRGNDF